MTAMLVTPGDVEPLSRARIAIGGGVQGVGFRPFIYRLASHFQLTGWVSNSAQGVLIEVEGSYERLERFIQQIEREKPPHSLIQNLDVTLLEPVGYRAFEIHHSDVTGAKTALVLPDIATCPECLREILDPANRRYRYPFTNCTHCGPRYSIIVALPYDRANTTMRPFAMCDQCREEYENPLDRRFHAQPNACPQCGPQLALWDNQGNILAAQDDALLQAAEAIRRGSIVAIKGLGGFQLVVDARDEEVVARLRARKHREEKPFALLYPSLEMVRAHCEVTELEKRLLTSSEAPIVLLHRGDTRNIGTGVAPGNPYLGVMLPYTPLHHLLMAELGFPVVATSGNVSDEPICIDEHEALERLGGIADLFLVHNRPIARHVDDSVVRVMAGREMVLRRARGYAPLPIALQEPAPPLIATGAHLKNTVALAVGRQVFLSQHIGDLETAPAFQAFQNAIGSMSQLYDLQAASIACDAHPHYLSSQYARASGLPVIQVQHHHAHVLACMAENELDGPALGIAWDGTGYGPDGTVWGGEFLRVAGSTFTRVAHLRTFRLPGGERAVREPRRAAIGLLSEVVGSVLWEIHELAPVGAFSRQELAILKTMLEREVNAPRTSSAGRLFDAVAAMIGLRQQASFEGQAAMELEFALEGVESDADYPFEVIKQPDATWIVDWAATIGSILHDLLQSVPVGTISVRFHNTLVEMMVAVTRRVGEPQVVLTGGCFQNRYLTERAIRRLRQEAFCPYWHQRVPPNDGSIALGQVVAAAKAQEE